MALPSGVDMSDRAPRQHPLNQDQTTRRSEPRVTVDHEKASSSVTLDTTKNGGLLPKPLVTNELTEYS